MRNSPLFRNPNIDDKLYQLSLISSFPQISWYQYHQFGWNLAPYELVPVQKTPHVLTSWKGCGTIVLRTVLKGFKLRILLPLPTGRTLEEIDFGDSMTNIIEPEGLISPRGTRAYLGQGYSVTFLCLKFG